MPKVSAATVKTLFAVSGNRCAFPGCDLPLVVDDILVGEMCHIKASAKGGPRYDPSQPANERDTFSNLILFCPTHHRIVDANLAIYTAQHLTQIKQEHEAQQRTKYVVNDTIVRRLTDVSIASILGMLVGSILGGRTNLGSSDEQSNRNVSNPPKAFSKRAVSGTVKWFNPEKGYGSSSLTMAPRTCLFISVRYIAPVSRISVRVRKYSSI